MKNPRPCYTNLLRNGYTQYEAERYLNEYDMATAIEKQNELKERELALKERELKLEELRLQQQAENEDEEDEEYDEEDEDEEYDEDESLLDRRNGRAFINTYGELLKQYHRQHYGNYGQNIYDYKEYDD